MSKRRAASQMTKEDFEREEEEPESSGPSFAAIQGSEMASSEVLRSRPIIKAKRNTMRVENTNDPGSNTPFAGLQLRTGSGTSGGFTFGSSSVSLAPSTSSPFTFGPLSTSTSQQPPVPQLKSLTGPSFSFGAANSSLKTGQDSRPLFGMNASKTDARAEEAASSMSTISAFGFQHKPIAPASFGSNTSKPSAPSFSFGGSSAPSSTAPAPQPPTMTFPRPKPDGPLENKRALASGSNVPKKIEWGIEDPQVNGENGEDDSSCRGPEYVRKIRKLNRDFVSFINDYNTGDVVYDFSPACSDYVNFMKKLKTQFPVKKAEVNKVVPAPRVLEPPVHNVSTPSTQTSLIQEPQIQNLSHPIGAIQPLEPSKSFSFGFIGSSSTSTMTTTMTSTSQPKFGGFGQASFQLTTTTPRSASNFSFGGPSTEQSFATSSTSVFGSTAGGWKPPQVPVQLQKPPGEEKSNVGDEEEEYIPPKNEEINADKEGSLYSKR